MRRLPDEPRPGDLALLLPAERSRAERFGRRRDAAAFASGHALLRRLAAERLGCRPAEVTLEAPPGAAPRIPGTELSCSLAHGGDIVVAALAGQGVVGVDVEPLDNPLSPDEAAWIAEQVLGAPEREVARVRSAPGAEGVLLVRWTLMRWALMEAVLKALGTGLGVDPREVRLDLDGRPRLVAAPGVPPAWAPRWRLDLFEPAPGHLGAIASSVDAGPPRVETVA